MAKRRTKKPRINKDIDGIPKEILKRYAARMVAYLEDPTQATLEDLKHAAESIDLVSYEGYRNGWSELVKTLDDRITGLRCGDKKEWAIIRSLLPDALHYERAVKVEKKISPRRST